MKLISRATLILITLAILAGSGYSADLTWDHDADGTPSDGGGNWLDANQWWDGAASATWNNTTPDNAIIGSTNGNGGTITLGNVVAGTVVFTNFSGSYTLSSGSLTNSGGILICTNAGDVRIESTIGGAGGLTVSNATGKTLTLRNEGNSYSGPTVVRGGVLQCGDNYQSADSIPGGIGAATDGSNLELNGGTFTPAYYFRRTLGSGAGQFQITGGNSGFNHLQADTYARLYINNDVNFVVVWGSAFFKPDVLILNDAGANTSQAIQFQNKLDLNGTNRTVGCNSTQTLSARVDSSNGDMDTAGGRFVGVISNGGGTPAGLIKVGPGHLQLEAANTYDGDTWVKEGTLSIYKGDDRIPAGSQLILGAGTTNAIFKLRGRSQALTNGLTTAGSGTSNSIINASSTEGALIVDVASGTNTFSGILGGSTDNDNYFNFTKTGAGELSVLQINNSRVTSVQAGTLRITESCGSNAMMSISAGATAILDFAGTYAIQALLLDGTPATPGVWGSPTSGAPNPSSLLEGPGKLSISGNYSTYYWDGPSAGGVGDGASDGGSGIWSTSSDNWDVSLVARRAWPATATNVDAVFAGATGYVTVAENLNVSNIAITVASPDDYTIAGNALIFAPSGSLTIASSYNNNWTEMATIATAITNSPAVYLDTLENTEVVFAPTNGSMSLGAVDSTSGTGNPGVLQLGGSTTGNTVASVRNNKIRCVGGEWTLLGDAYQRNQHFVDGGTLIVNGDLSAGNSKGIRVSSNATIVVNGSVAKINGNTTLTFNGNNEGASGTPGGTLKGTGVIYQTSSGVIDITEPATVAPGYPTGTLTLTNNNCSIAGTLAIVFDGVDCSRLLVDGSLDLTSGTATLDVDTTGSSGNEFIIATFDSLVSGTQFAATNNLPGSWEVVYEATQIKLVPPPSGTMLIIK